jgi:hypothetical protein
MRFRVSRLFLKCIHPPHRIADRRPQTADLDGDVTGLCGRGHDEMVISIISRFIYSIIYVCLMLCAKLSMSLKQAIYLHRDHHLAYEKSLPCPTDARCY